MNNVNLMQYNILSIYQYVGDFNICKPLRDVKIIILFSLSYNENDKGYSTPDFAQIPVIFNLILSTMDG